MSSARNRSHSTLALPAGRVHCVRVRRMMSRKHHLQRREICFSAVQDSALATDESMCHQPRCMDSEWNTNMASHYSAAGNIPNHRRCNLAIGRRLVPYRALEHHRDDVCSMMPMDSASPFSIGCNTNQREEVAGTLLLPLPPAIQRIHMAGSPFSPLAPSNAYDFTESSFNQRQVRPGNLLGGARAHSSGGGGSGGGGGSDGSATAPADMNPGGGDATDGDQPSEYTFRRRNAIVEGSEDAPKSDDFPSESPK